MCRSYLRTDSCRACSTCALRRRASHPGPANEAGAAILSNAGRVIQLCQAICTTSSMHSHRPDAACGVRLRAADSFAGCASALTRHRLECRRPTKRSLPRPFLEATAEKFRSSQPFLLVCWFLTGRFRYVAGPVFSEDRADSLQRQRSVCWFRRRFRAIRLLMFACGGPEFSLARYIDQPRQNTQCRRVFKPVVHKVPPLCH